jgi:crotonobetainyl-CoA:carnitine CoA-transferase CaiB-like acyl-CoA transferase
MDQTEFDRMKPLEGMRVLTFEQFGAGPYGSMFLADLGAEVIKIENAATGGDPSRHVGPHMVGDEDSQYFQTWNMNKRSVALDIKSAQGRADFERLVRTADAVMNNLRGDQPEKLRLDYASLKDLNPKIVCLHISAYGRDNERKSWPGYDFLMQAEAGLMGLTGEADGPPSRIGPSMIDYMTGMTGVVGLLGCIMRARQTGLGCDVDASLFDVALHQLGYSAIWYLNEKDVARRQPRSAHLSVAPVQTFPTADGWIYLMCMTDKFWESLADAVGRPDLKSDARFCSQALRRHNREALTQALDEELRRRPTQEWLDIFSGVLPVAPVLEMDQALDAPFVDAIGMVRTVPHPRKADFRVLANPLKIDGQRPDQVASPALGAGNKVLLGNQPAVAAPALSREPV